MPVCLNNTKEYHKQNYYPLAFQLHYNCHQEYLPNQNQELELHKHGKEDFLPGRKKKDNKFTFNKKNEKEKKNTFSTVGLNFLT